MQAISDEQQIERLEKRIDRFEASLKAEIKELGAKMENGFAAIRSETRADFRTLFAVLMAILAAVIFGFAGILLEPI